ncbi:NlpC-P60 family protein [Lysobacter pythonis]|uniref:NlpC-P60 family protein n=2 Tax=Solilutibacter pythonis TaxID=2483112 RepID=A0A3M2HSQ0_9GAMM|nr:NlpC-P60 family protein [Lysobacter pythonis]
MSPDFPTPRPRASCLILLLCALPALAAARGAASRAEADAWIARSRTPDRILLDADAITARNRRLLAEDASMHDLRALPPTMPGNEVRAMVMRRSVWPRRALYGSDARALGAASRERLQTQLALARIPDEVHARFGLVVRRADLRTFPDARPVFHRPGERLIDRFQESALFPGTLVRILHESLNGDWLFVMAPDYAAWVRADRIAAAAAAEVFAYVERQPALIVTGSRVLTDSGIALDMGTRVPLSTDRPDGGYVIDLPTRDPEGRLRLRSARLPNGSDVARAPLPFTERTLLTQAFKFLGEPYGWGHSFDARDCSGFVADVHAAFGLRMPRNTGDQAASPAFTRIAPPTNATARQAMLAALEPGDLLYLPGHVMMVIGQRAGETWVIHDTPEVRLARPGGGIDKRPGGVVVTPLQALRFEDGRAYVDAIRRIVRLRR